MEKNRLAAMTINAGKTIAMVLFGIALNAFAVAAFCLPYNILVGGSTGIGRLINHFSGMPVSLAILIVGLILLILAWIFLGKQYAASIVLGTISYPAFLALFELFPIHGGLVDDPLLAALCGGFLMGVGIGIVIRAGASMGGSDVIPQILHKKANLPIGPVMYGLDVTVLILQGFLATSNEIILGIMMVLTYTIVTEKTLLAGGGQVQFLIFSPKNEEIRDMLIENGLGVTMLHGKSGYYGEEVDVIITALSGRRMNKIKDRILAIDSTAFITISSVREIDGRGFTVKEDT